MERIAALQQLEREVGVLMRRSRRAVRDRALMVHPELAGPAYLMLSFLIAHGPSRASDLADAFQLDKGAVSRAVHSLEELGLIRKEADPEDRRAMILHVEPEARRRMLAVSEQRLARLESLLEDWTLDDIGDFVESFVRYNALLEASLSPDLEPLPLDCD